MSSVAPTPHPPSDPLARWLRHPFRTEQLWLHRLLHAVTADAQRLIPLVIAVVALLLVYGCFVCARHQRWARAGRWISIAAPVDVEPDGGRALWCILAPLLTTQPTVIGRRPPVVFEAWADSTGLRLGIWISPTLSVAAVAHAIRTAWPGAAATHSPTPALPAGRGISGGQLRLARAEWMPLATDAAGGDPIRGVLAAIATDAREDAAVIQVLARPAPSRRVVRMRRAARALRRGQATSGTARMLDFFAGRAAPASGQATTDPVLLADVRQIGSKAGEGPHFQVAIRYAVSGSTGWSARRYRRARIRQIAAAFGLYTARNRLVSHHLCLAARRVATRRMHRGFVLSADELAALAHLPVDATGYGLPAAPARTVAPPPQVAHD